MHVAKVMQGAAVPSSAPPAALPLKVPMAGRGLRAAVPCRSGVGKVSTAAEKPRIGWLGWTIRILGGMVLVCALAFASFVI